jgi:hypothetical protein
LKGLLLLLREIDTKYNDKMNEWMNEWKRERDIEHNLMQMNILTIKA